MRIGDRIKQLRKEKGITQEELAKATGISRVTLGFYERNDSPPPVDTLCAIAKYFGVTADFLLGLSNARESENAILVQQLGLTEDSIQVLKKLVVISALSASDLFTKVPNSPDRFFADLMETDSRTYLDLLNIMLVDPVFMSEIMPLMGLLSSPSFNILSTVNIPKTQYQMNVEPCLRLALHEALDSVVIQMRREAQRLNAENSQSE